MKRLYISITKGDALRFLGHLDFLRTMERAIMRARIPVLFSEGFNPHMKLSFDAALGVGVAADPLYMTLIVEDDVTGEAVREALTAQLSPGIVIGHIREAENSGMKLANFFTEDRYEMEGPVPEGADPLAAEEGIRRFNSLPSFLYRRVTPKKIREMDVKPMLAGPVEAEIQGNRGFLRFSLHRSTTGSIQPKDLWKLLSESFGLPWTPGEFICSRTGTFRREGDRLLTPFDRGAFPEGKEK